MIHHLECVVDVAQVVTSAMEEHVHRVKIVTIDPAFRKL